MIKKSEGYRYNVLIKKPQFLIRIEVFYTLNREVAYSHSIVAGGLELMS